MEEIDKIIIESLKNLHCDIGDEVICLKQFDADLTVSSISTCLEQIIHDTKFPKKLPPSMSIKLKIASNLAQQIKDLGFRGDMGYQTILYCNEVETRRVLMFLIERLPRENSKVGRIEITGYVPNLIKEIEDKIKVSLGLFWVPTSILNEGCRRVDDVNYIETFANSYPVSVQNLEIPDYTVNDQIFKQYWIRTIPDITKQCSPKQLIPSLLFPENKCISSKLRSILTGSRNIQQLDVELTEIKLNDQYEKNDDDNNKEIVVEKAEDKLALIIEKLKKQKVSFAKLQDQIKNDEIELAQVNTMKNDEEEVLKSTLSKIKIKSKTLAVISKEENKLKLKNLVEKGTDRLVDLANQWNQVQTPLLEEYKTIQNSLSNEEMKLQQEQAKFKQLKDSYKLLNDDLKEKEGFEQILRKKCEQMNKSYNRSGYTRRILEIIGNVKKQNEEIYKILNDTKNVQKDINTLTGQVDRSFTLSDELIFQDAKHDETARKAYKLLASLRDECCNIIKLITDLGLAERESRNLQEQIDTESAKEIGVKLQKVNQDLEEIRKETTNLLK